MDGSGLIFILIIGAVAGWFAGKIMKGKGFGLIGNIVVGVVGAVLGSFLFSQLGVSVSGLIASLVSATTGAILVLWVVSLATQKKEN